MSWINDDGLYVKFGTEEAAANKGGTYNTLGPLQVTEVKIDYTDMLSATSTRIGSDDGSLGVQLPKGAHIEKIETAAEVAATSSGTVGSATFVLGLVKDDLATENDYDGLLTSSATFSTLSLSTKGKLVQTVQGGTGAGALVGAELANSGYLTIANSAHASHPLTAGKFVVRIYWYMPTSGTDKVG